MTIRRAKIKSDDYATIKLYLQHDVFVFYSIHEVATWLFQHKFARSYYAATIGVRSVLAGKSKSYKHFTLSWTYVSVD